MLLKLFSRIVLASFLQNMSKQSQLSSRFAVSFTKWTPDNMWLYNFAPFFFVLFCSCFEHSLLTPSALIEVILLVTFSKKMVIEVSNFNNLFSAETSCQHQTLFPVVDVKRLFGKTSLFTELTTEIFFWRSILTTTCWGPMLFSVGLTSRFHST